PRSARPSRRDEPPVTRPVDALQSLQASWRAVIRRGGHRSTEGVHATPQFVVIGNEQSTPSLVAACGILAAARTHLSTRRTG
ncbi:MAG: hypothetical protein WCJ30_28555, partial [Deltaproteobacteria bacterium]